MRFLLGICIVLLFSFNTLLANEITLEDHYKVIGTFSGDLQKKETFHIVIAKNKQTKLYEIIPISYYNNSLIKLSSIEFEYKPSIKSYHSKGHKVTLLISLYPTLIGKVLALDINMNSGEHKLSKVITDKDIKASLLKPDKNFLITKHSDGLEVIKVTDASTTESIVFSKNKDNNEFFKNIYSSNFGAVNTSEFVENGSIDNFKIYSEENTLYLTKDNLFDRFSTVLKLDFDSVFRKSYSVFKDFQFEQFRTVREMSSYMYDNKFYQLLLSKETGFIKIINIETSESINITLSDENLSNRGDSFKTIESLLKEAIKGKYTPTITVNKSYDDMLIIRCDYVDSSTYNYNNNGNLGNHHEQFLMHHQQMINSGSSFGPNSWLYDFHSDFYNLKNEHYVELVLDKNFNIVIKEDIRSKFKNIDKKKYTKSIDENESIKHVSSVFLDNAFVCFYLDIKSNTFQISQKPIIE